jgi:hypothetical protein
MKSFLLFISLFLVCNCINAQQIKTNFACNYFGKKVTPQEICPQMQGYVSESHAERVIGQFAKKMGQISSKFKVMQCSNTDNCFATVIDGQPFIIYDRAFLNRVEETTQTDWAAISILAHEIGHHANFHTIDGTGSRPDKELEADYFSGFWLHEMGANLQQCQEAMNHFQAEVITSTHPPRSQRLMAIQKGWNEAESNHPNLITNASPKVQPLPVELPTKIEPKPSDNQEDIVIENVTSMKKLGCIVGNCSYGKGTFVHETQGSYEGNWRNGKRDGFGIHYYANGDKMYEGEYVAGKRQGNGIYYFSSGERYEGRFLNDKTTPNGTFVLLEDDEGEVELTYITSDGKKEKIHLVDDEE